MRRYATRLCQEGVEVIAALPVNPVRRRLARLDLRNHRKLAVIDGRVAYTGSQNIVRADYGKTCRLEWRDLMIRIVGPSVGRLQAVFLEDWEFDTGQFIDDPYYFPPPESHGRVPLQIVPSGPHQPTQVLRDLAVEALGAARRKVGIITPYFVPDEALLVAMRLAVVRGVRVDLIVPARSDQLLTDLASHFFIDELLEQGVHVHLHGRGLLHAKAMIVDDDFAILGTANFDIRSFYLNFELSLLSYDGDLNARLRCYQCRCLRESIELNLTAWRGRSKPLQLGAQSAKLLSPLL